MPESSGGAGCRGTTEALPRTVVLFQTHYLNKHLVRLVKRLICDVPDYDVRVLMHLPSGTPKPAALANLAHHFVTTPEVRNAAYTDKIGAGTKWRIWRGGHTDLIALHFFNAHPTYERYWFLEYDIRFSGEWSEFFSCFQGSDADLLSTSIRRASTHPDWMHWPTLRVPPEVGALSDAERLCNFMPIVRISRRGLQAIDAGYRAGWGGHCEVTWPTILHHAGLNIEDYGGDGEFVRSDNRNRFYTNTLTDRDLSPGSVVFRPARIFPGFRRNRLWHPVKPLQHKLREDARHMWVAMKPFFGGWFTDDRLGSRTSARQTRVMVSEELASRREPRPKPT
jgi:hypothetical protein